jgi:benzoate-CoA ligase family protein
LLYTSGTTGKPKGVIHRHRDLAPTAELYARAVLGIGPDDRIFSSSPLYFAYGLGNSLTFPLWLGAEAVLLPQRVTPEEIFRVLASEQPTVFFSVPTLYARLLAHSDAPSVLGRIRFCVSAGEALPPAIFDSWLERFGVEIVNGLGSTEMLHVFLSNRPGACIPGTCGSPVPGYEVRVVDDADSDVSDDCLGNLLAGGPSSAAGYWKQADRTAQTMFAPGWLRTGDTARRSGEGTYTLFGRHDDLFKVSGIYVSPDEIQAALQEHPAVLEAGVVEERDATGLARPCAFVTLHEGWLADDALAVQLRQHVKERLAPYKAPKRIVFRTEPLPRNAVGKLQRSVLREELS